MRAQRHAAGALEQRRAREDRLGAGRRPEDLPQTLQHRIDRRRRLLSVVFGVGILATGQGAADRQGQLLFHPPAAHREISVRAARLQELGDRLLMGEVALEAAARLGPVRLPCAHIPLVEKRAAHRLAQAGILRQPLDQELGGAGQRGGNVGHALVGVTEGERAGLGCLSGSWRRGAVAAVPQPVRQGLEPGLSRDGRLGLPLLLVRQVQIFQHAQLEGGQELFLEARGSAFPAARSRRR